MRGVRLLATPGATPGPLIDLWIAGADLAAIIPAGTAPVAAGVQTLDAASCLAVPGLVNAHTHWYTALLADTVPGAPLDLFVLEAMARLAPRSPRMVYVSALVHGLLLLKRGVTGLVDHVRHGVLPSVEALGACVRAYRDLGLRATVRARWAGMRKPPPQTYFALMDAVLHWRGHSGRLDVMLGADGPQRCSPRLLELTGRYAEQHALGLHTHLLGGKTQLMMARGSSWVQVLDRHGLVNPRSSLAHFVWCTPRDCALVADRGANVVHNPMSNLHLGSGLQPPRRLLDRGCERCAGHLQRKRTRRQLARLRQRAQRGRVGKVHGVSRANAWDMNMRSPGPRCTSSLGELKAKAASKCAAPGTSSQRALVWGCRAWCRARDWRRNSALSSAPTATSVGGKRRPLSGLARSSSCNGLQVVASSALKQRLSWCAVRRNGARS